MKKQNRLMARGAGALTAVAAGFWMNPMVARADDPFTSAPINLTNLMSTDNSALGGPGTNNAGNTTRTQDVPVVDKPDVNVDVATVSTSASLQNPDANPTPDRLRLLGTATATRTNNILPAGTSSSSASIDATANFVLPSTTGAGANQIWYRKWDIRLDATVTGTLSGSVNGAAGAPVPAWDSTLIRSTGAPPTLATFVGVNPVHYISKGVGGGLQSAVDLNSTQNPNGNFPILPDALVKGGSAGAVILTSVPDTYQVEGRLVTAVSAQSTTAGGFRGSSASADIRTGANEMDVDVKAFGVVAKQKPKAWMDPQMNFVGNTVSMDAQPLSAVQTDNGQIDRLDDPSPGDAILAPAFSDPNSVLVNVGDFSVTNSSNGIVSFTDAPFSITINGSPVLTGTIDDITASTLDPSNPSLDGNIDVTSVNNSIGSQWLAEMTTDTTQFSFDPDFVTATDGFTMSASGFQGVNLITVPEPATAGLLMAVAMAGCLRRRRSHR